MFNRPHFLHLVDSIVTRRIHCLVVAHKDCLVRFGFELLDHLCQTHDCRLIVVHNDSVSPEQEMVQDMLAIVHCFSAQSDGLRHYCKALAKALKDDTSAQNSLASDS